MGSFQNWTKTRWNFQKWNLLQYPEAKTTQIFIKTDMASSYTEQETSKLDKTIKIEFFHSSHKPEKPFKML